MLDKRGTPEANVVIFQVQLLESINNPESIFG